MSTKNGEETSNSSNSDYTQLVSVSLTTASTECKSMCIFLHYLTFTKYDLLIHHNAIVTLVTEQNWQMIDMVVEKEKAGKTMAGQPQAQPQETPREQPEATPA